MIKIQKLINQHRYHQLCHTFTKYIRPTFSFTISKDKASDPKPDNLEEIIINPESKPEKSESINNFMIFPIKHVLFPYSSYFTRISSTHHELLTRLKIQYVAAFLSKEALQNEQQHTQEIDSGQHEVETTQPTVEEAPITQEDSKVEPEEKIEEERKVRRTANFPLNTKTTRSKRFRDALAAGSDNPDDNDVHHIIIYDDNISMHYGQTIDIVDQEGRLKVVTNETMFNAPVIKSLDDIYQLGVMCKLTLQTLPGEAPDKKPENFAILKSLHRVKALEEISKISDIKELLLNNTNKIGNMPGVKGFKSRTFFKKLLGEIEKSEQDEEVPTPSTLDEDIKTLMEQYKFTKIQHLYSASSISEKALTDAYRTKLSTLIGYYTKMRMKVQINVPELFLMPDDPRMLDIICGFLAATTFFNNKELQHLLETIPAKERLDVCLKYFIRYEKNFITKWDDLEKGANLPLDPNSQKEQYIDMYNFLKRSSENPYKKPVVEKIKANMEGKKFPSEVLKLINEDLSRFTEMSESHPDYNIYRSFLELITSLPFGIHSQDNFDIKNAKQMLDDDHYGMEDVKDRILEFIAVAKLKGNIRGKSLLLVGPPGVGKTSIGASIGKCLNRKFARISLGGEYDVSILKGHRKTYLGAYPGKIVQALRNCDTENPVIMLDEVDKTGQGTSGNLQDVLLEVLDPVQNTKFTDHFLDTPIDLSNVLFVCTANLLETIHPALLDRMEVIQLSGYTKEEKCQILLKYLLPKALEHAGLNERFGNAIKLTDDAIDKLLLSYSREAGVRNLERFIKRICEKLALKFLTQKPDQITINTHNLYEFVGLPIFSDQRLYENIPPPGVVIGLAYNSYGGSIIFIETVKANYDEIVVIQSEKIHHIEEKSPTDITLRKGTIKITGSLGDVMQESIQIAYSHAKYLLNTYYNSHYLEVNDVHIHFPEGATKKDGPSAGVAITTSLISLALNATLPDVIGMTGEMSLTGKVLKIGGVKEKVLAAKRENIKKLLLPLGNKQDVEDLKDYIKEGIEFSFAENYEDVIKILFSQIPKQIIYENEGNEYHA